MGMDTLKASDTDEAMSKFSDNFVFEALVNGVHGIEESSSLSQMLTRLDINLAFSSEKLANLDLFRVIVSLGEIRDVELPVQNSIILDVEIEKELRFDLSLGYLDSEVTELGCFLNVLRTGIIDAHKKLHSAGQRRETYAASEDKLHAFECSWKHLQEQLSGLERRLANMQRTPFSHENPANSFGDATFERSGPDLQTAGQQRLVLRMLDESLSGELDLEKQLLESREREEELKSKLLITNVSISDLESFVEVALGKLLEAEHSSEVYKGFTKEMMSRLQILEFNMHCSDRREGELKSKLHSTLDQLKEKETALRDIEDKFAELNQSFQEKPKWEEKVKALEAKLQISESMLKEVNASYDVSQEQLSLMENTVESLRELGFIAEARAQSAEDKLASITEEIIELREEVTFLKGGDENVDKLSLLETQVRDFEVQLQTAKTTCEASLEQQNMLYTAIWDMETLIEELRSKVANAEIRADRAEMQCLGLAETSIKLNKEISCLRSNNEVLEESIKEANEINVARAKDINSGAKLITEVVMQLASERERIQKQLSALAKENKILLEELRRMRKICAKADQNNKEFTVKDSGAIVNDPDTGVSIAGSTVEDVVETTTSTTASNQVDEPADQNIRDDAEASSSSTPDVDAANATDDETESKGLNRHINKKYYYTFTTIMVLVLSILAMNINWQDIASVLNHQYLGFR